MRTILLTTVAAAAMASPAWAVAPPPPLFGGAYVGSFNNSFYSNVVGGIEFDLSRVWDNHDSNFNAFSGAARANIPLRNGWNVLVETGGGAFFDDGDSISAIGANAHFWRNAGNMRYGFLGGVNFAGINFGKIGAEAEYDINNRITLGAQLSYSFASPDCCDNVNILGFRAYWDYYFTQNTKFTGQFAYYDVSDGSSEDFWAFEKRLTHRFDGTPFNVFGNLGYVHEDSDNHAWSFGGGFSVLLDGSGTQKSYDQNVPFDALDGPPLFALAPSDRRLKADIVKVGMLTPDIPLYRFRYIWGDEVFVGVMAQDLLAVRPDAVILNDSGYYSVNYAALGTRMMRLEEWQALHQAAENGRLEAQTAVAAAG